MNGVHFVSLKRPAAMLAFVAVLISGCVSEPSPITGQKKTYGYSWEQEMQLGAEADKQVAQDMGVYDDPALQTYVEMLGRRVLESSDLRDPKTAEIYRNAKFQFRVVNSPVVNAFALPGGYVYVTRGLLAYVENEAQLAVVLGHEIGHVAARHASQQALRAQRGQLGLIAGALLGQQVLGGAGQDVASNILNIGGQAFQLLMLRYSRSAESEADSLGVRYAGSAGYATAEAADFFRSLERISASEGKAIPSWQSTHPDPGDRAQKVKAASGAWRPVGGGELVIGRDELLKHLDGIVVGEDPREGYAKGGVFYHPSLRFQFPIAPGWNLENESSAVLMTEPNQQAILGFQAAPGANSREAAAQFAKESGAQIVSSNETQVNGLPATLVLAQATTDQGPVGIFDAFIELEGKVYSFLGYAPTQAFAQFQPVFRSVVSGFAPLRDPAYLNVSPARLKIVAANRTAPFRNFIGPELPAGLTPEQLAIMNQVTLDQTVQEGQPLKLPTMGSDTPHAPRPFQAVRSLGSRGMAAGE
jgi:predicted Zn-dependent protease